MTKRRSAAAILALLLTLAVFSSAFFIIAEANHDCAGEDCQICCFLSVCENALRTFGSLSASAVFAVFSAAAAVILLTVASRAVTAFSLVTLKVKLSD